MRSQKKTNNKDLEPIFKPEADQNFHLVSEQEVEIKIAISKKKKSSVADMFQR